MLCKQWLQTRTCRSCLQPTLSVPAAGWTQLRSCMKSRMVRAVDWAQPHPNRRKVAKAMCQPQGCRGWSHTTLFLYQAQETLMLIVGTLMLIVPPTTDPLYLSLTMSVLGTSICPVWQEVWKTLWDIFNIFFYSLTFLFRYIVNFSHP